ncbi:MAG: MBL fold metallo-hydrolase [Clostridia bacterium]|nr:MBL fold metallo-hydrolase [Clostridia bacterium]
MSNQATVTYLYHSGFLVSVEDTLLVFDYWEGDNRSLPLRARITERDFEPYRRVFVFVSHNHADHFDEVIYTWDRAKYNITYIVSYDIPTGKRGKRMAPGDVANYDRMEIRAFDSTDKGVSWYVDLDGVRIFHAGDLNLWHWHEVSTVRQVKQAEDDFYAACAPIIELPIDLCMFPLDPRLGGMYDAGINYFVMAAKPRVVIPMHWQERTEVPASYVRQAGKEIPYTEVLALIQPRERADLTFGDV